MANAPLTALTGGVILAGGRSSRFGSDKATARFGGRMMMERVLDRFAPLAMRAVNARVGSAAAARASALGITVLADAASAPAGPLAGISAGLAWAKSKQLRLIATAPCDTPLLPEDIFPALLAALADAPAAYAATGVRDHPLCAVWRIDVQEQLDVALSYGRHPPVRDLLATLSARRVPFGDVRAFSNANTRDDLAALERAA